jgi:putative ABC transport system permease protein
VSWRAAFRLASGSLLRRPARTLLTVLGVAVGSALLVALGSIASVAESRAVEHFGQGLPVGAIKVAPAAPQPWQLQTDEFETIGPKEIDDDALRQIRSLPSVRSVVPIQAAPVLVVPPAGDSFSATMVGTDVSVGGDLPVSLLAGRLPAPASLTEVAVTQSYLDHVHAGQPDRSALGDRIQVAEPSADQGSAVSFRPRWFRAKVVGVVSQDISGADLLVPLDQTRAARAWQLSGAGEAPSFGGEVDPNSPYSALIVVASSVDTLHAVRAGIDRIGYATSAPEKVLGAVLRYLHVVDIVLAGIGAIALLLAGLNIANALFAAVRERRREIGVLKAIGAEDRDVLRWFLLEATLTGLAGGLLGMVWGVLMAQVLAARVADYLAQQGVSIAAVGAGDLPVGVLVFGVLGSWLLALLAAALPALRAARLPATEAMAEL